MEIRQLVPADASAARDFFHRIPEGDRTFFKEDVLDDETVAGWAHDRHNRRLVAVDDDGTVIGYLGIIPGVGWSSHVGEIRLVVDPERRRHGLGRELARRGLIEALELGLTKIMVEVVADQTPAVALFASLGFDGEALLRDHVRDRNGDLRDLMVLSHAVGENWELMATAGIEDALR